VIPIRHWPTTNSKTTTSFRARREITGNAENTRQNSQHLSQRRDQLLQAPDVRGGRDSSVGIVTIPLAGQRTTRSSIAGRRNYLHRNVPTDYGANPVSYIIGAKYCFRGLKRKEREADHSPPSSTEVKKCEAIPGA
jgi:hypothetical protein